MGAATFGVLLIHANSGAMITWLWKDTVNCIDHFNLPLGHLALYSIGVILTVFLVCSLIDQLRINTVERWFFRWYDNNLSIKAERFTNLLTEKHYKNYKNE